MAEITDFEKSEYFTNRELSWIDFNYRILGEARDKENKLFEKMKFLSITASNLDEFFMVRVASLKDMVNADCSKKDISGMTPCEQLEAVNEKVHSLVNLQYSTYNRSIVPGLKQNKLNILNNYKEMSDEQKIYADRFFEEEVYPVLTPMAVDSSRPFPLIRNKSLNIAVLMSKKDDPGQTEFATVQVPSVLPRYVLLPSDSSDKNIILLEQIIQMNINKLFLNHDVISSHPYRIMRNADFSIEEEEAADLLKEIKKQLKKRQWGEIIRLETDEKIDKRLLKILKKELHIREQDIFFINGPIDLTFLMKLYGIKGFDKLKDKKFTPQPVPGLNIDEDIFTQISAGDILLHHPYMTFEPVVEFIRQAARDEKVLAIKQTLYRVSGNSPIIASLAEAAENGKQVTVLVELKARFDEENNIIWAQKLEKAGCHVIYGLLGLKTHSKITLVVRREENGIRRYVHLGTGNYNDATAKLYTDMGLLTCNTSIGEDATAVFNMISGYSEPLAWNKLSLAPIWLREKFLYLIRRETKFAKEGKQSFITAKMNSLCDKRIIAALYEASAAGVKVNLIVRGICCLKTGIPGVSENITVRSIVGMFLEHSRIFYFHNDGNEEVFMGSADWMPRNLDKRVEILFPVEDIKLKQEVIHILNIQLADNVKAQILNETGEYSRIDRRGKKKVASQEYFCNEAYERTKKREEEQTERVFTPMEHTN